MIAMAHAAAARFLGLRADGGRLAHRRAGRAGRPPRSAPRPSRYDDAPGRRRRRGGGHSPAVPRRRRHPHARRRCGRAAGEAAVHARSSEADRIVAAAARSRRAAAVRREPRLRARRAAHGGARAARGPAHPPGGALAAGAARRGVRSPPTSGAAARCSTWACTRSPSRCCWPTPPAKAASVARVGRAARRRRATAATSTPRSPCTSASGFTAHVVSSWQGGPEPVWDAQLAGDQGVVRAELLPALRLELNGDEVALPPTTAPLPHPGAVRLRGPAPRPGRRRGARSASR